MIRDLIDVVVEIPAGSRNKYEFDSDRRAIRLVRQLPASLVYPGDYGFVPGTEGADGDPLDVLVLTDAPTFPGCWLGVVPLGVLYMDDDAGRDPKVIGVLPERAHREGLEDLSDLPEQACDELEHFFTIYKELEPEMSAHTAGFGDRGAARDEILEALDRFAKSAAAFDALTAQSA
jgi:inorganic pyrophosphatase